MIRAAWIWRECKRACAARRRIQVNFSQQNTTMGMAATLLPGLRLLAFELMNLAQYAADLISVINERGQNIKFLGVSKNITYREWSFFIFIPSHSNPKHVNSCISTCHVMPRIQKFNINWIEATAWEAWHNKLNFRIRKSGKGFEVWSGGKVANGVSEGFASRTFSSWQGQQRSVDGWSGRGH